MYSDGEAGGRERVAPRHPNAAAALDPAAGRGAAVGRDRCHSASPPPGSPPRGFCAVGVARWGCSRTGPAFIAVGMTQTLQ